MGQVGRAAPHGFSGVGRDQAVVESGMLTGMKRGEPEVTPVRYDPRVTSDWNRTSGRLTSEPRSVG
jgi:hypothetical protein